jgi:hypothetical protein
MALVVASADRILVSREAAEIVFLIPEETP